jgi:hypothetical protein
MIRQQSEASQRSETLASHENAQEFLHLFRFDGQRQRRMPFTHLSGHRIDVVLTFHVTLGLHQACRSQCVLRSMSLDSSPENAAV